MKQMPEHLPKLPDGAVYLGRGGEFKISGEPFAGWRLGPNLLHEPHDEWVWSSELKHRGTYPSWHYAAPADSEIARLNGCGKPSWDEAPEWAEYRTQDADGDWSWFSHKPEKHEILDFWCTPGASKWEHAFEGPPNPNFQDTLERRPRKSSKLELKIDASELSEALDSAIRGAKESGELPDLVIPKDAAEMMNSSGYVSALSEIGYRLEIDKVGIRGWKNG